MPENIHKENFSRAMLWRSMGVSAFPIGFCSKRPLVKWSAYREACPKPIELKRFFTSQKTNIGVICGGNGGLVVVDFDTEDGYKQFITDIPKSIKSLFEKTYRVKTPRGAHVYFRSPGVPSSKDIERKIDIKAEGGYVVAPFSIHPSGINYFDMLELNKKSILTIEKGIIKYLFNQKAKINKFDWDSVEMDVSDKTFLDENADIDDIRRRVSILRLAMDYTVMFHKSGHEFYMGKCPLPSHDDHDPSFWVNTRLGICGCFGGCELSEKSTDVIGLYAKINGLSYGEAIKRMKEW